MMRIEIKDFMGINGIIVVCPYCKSKQTFTTIAVCNECYEPIPFAGGLLTNVNDRVNFFNGLEPWDY